PVPISTTDDSSKKIMTRIYESSRGFLMEAGFTARFLRNHTFHFGFHMTEISFIDCSLLDRPQCNHEILLKRDKDGFMEERYKGHIIRVTTEKDNSAYPWKPICKILDGASRAIIKEIDWQLGYDTLERA